MMWFVWGWLLACGGPDIEIQCDAETPCGWGESCIDGQCVAGICATSQQCPIEHYCTGTGECAVGCETANDCFPGDVCGVDGVCETGSCTETQLDCDFREYCNTTTGECYDAGDQFCRPCTEDEECGEGNYCFAKSCGVDCSTTGCPAGFDCTPFVNSNDEIIAYQCITYCWLYDLESLSAPLPERVHVP
jgi:hypothetical protein